MTVLGGLDDMARENIGSKVVKGEGKDDEADVGTEGKIRIVTQLGTLHPWIRKVMQHHDHGSITILVPRKVMPLMTPLSTT